MPHSHTHSLTHLTATQKRSNDELDAALQEAPGDEDFATARAENEGVIARKEALLTELRRELQGLKASLVQAVGAANAAAVMEPSGPMPVPVAGAGSPVAAVAAAASQRQQAPAAASSGPQLPLEEEEEGAGGEQKEGGVYL